MAIAQQVRSEMGELKSQEVDVEVWLRAGKNGDRLIAQSDRARTLESPDQVKQYVEAIHVAARQHQSAKALYEKLSSSIQRHKRSIVPYRLDLEIQFQAKAGNIKNIDRLLMHSEVTKTLSKEDPVKAQRYVKAISEIGRLYESLRESPNQDAVNRSIPQLVRKKLMDLEAVRRLRDEEELRRQQELRHGMDGPVL